MNRETTAILRDQFQRQAKAIRNSMMHWTDKQHDFSINSYPDRDDYMIDILQEVSSVCAKSERQNPIQDVNEHLKLYINEYCK